MNARIFSLLALCALVSSQAASAATIIVTGVDGVGCDLPAAVALANGPDAAVHPACVRSGDTPGVTDPVDTISFADTVPDEVAVEGTLVVTEPLTILGADRITLVVDARQRHFTIAVDPDAFVTLDGLALRGDSSLSANGGVRVVSGTLRIRRSTLDGNVGQFGGAVHVDPGAELEVTDTTFSRNEARRVVRAACAPEPVALGSASTFVVLAGGTITSTGPSAITGDVGVSPGTAITGFPPATLNGTMHAGDAIAAQAKLDLTTAFDDAAGRTLCATALAGNIGGTTLAPGLYTSTSSLAISSGDLVLDAQGDGDAVFMFQMASTLVTTSDRRVILVNGADAANVYWQVGSSATIGTNSVMVGTIMASASITLTTGASLVGRALTQVGSVTLDANTVIAPAAPEMAGGEAPGNPLIGDGVEGGAVDCLGTCRFERVLFVQNSAIGSGPAGDAQGGALHGFDADVTLVNTTFVGNFARAGLSPSMAAATAARGGAVSSFGGSLEVAFTTVVGNSVGRELADVFALASGGAFYFVPGVAGDYTLYATIVSSNTAVVGSDCVLLGLADLVTSYSLFDGATARVACQGDAVTNLDGAVVLSGLADNGGPTQTLRLAPSSLAFDGVPLAACGPAGALDQRAYPRPVGAACDIGALELENLSLAIDGPTMHLVPAGATTDQSVTLSWVIDAPVPADDVAFTFAVSAGVSATVRDAADVALVGCAADGPDRTRCALGDLSPGALEGTITLVFAAAATSAIDWDGLITFAFEDADALDDADAGRITILFCDDGAVTAPETCDDSGAPGGCNDTCSGCLAGFGGSDCLTCLGLDDANPCTDDVCDPALGAVHTNNVAGCSDGDACTTLDLCAAGACVPGAALVVDDGNGCTTDTCDVVLGAVHTNNTLACDDDDACTALDVCSSGACVGGADVDVDDGDACTLDRCDPATGVVHTADPACDEGFREAGAGGCAGAESGVSWLVLLGCAMVFTLRRRVARIAA